MSLLTAHKLGERNVDPAPDALGGERQVSPRAYLFAKIGCEPAPMLLGFILGPMMEEFFRRALLISRGDFVVFVESPISAGLLVIATALLVSMSLPAIAQWRGKVIAEQNS